MMAVLDFVNRTNRMKDMQAVIVNADRFVFFRFSRYRNRGIIAAVNPAHSAGLINPPLIKNELSIVESVPVNCNEAIMALKEQAMTIIRTNLWTQARPSLEVLINR